MWILAILSSYLLGSLPWGLWIGYTKGIDVRRHGSGNLGATNVSRVLGYRLGLIVFLLDVSKGSLAVLLEAVGDVVAVLGQMSVKPDTLVLTRERRRLLHEVRGDGEGGAGAEGHTDHGMA